MIAWSRKLLKTGPIVFLTRYPLSRPNAANCAIWQSIPERWGCSICVYNPAVIADSTGNENPEGLADSTGLAEDGNIENSECIANHPAEPKKIFSDENGSIYDMNLSLDGKTLFF